MANELIRKNYKDIADAIRSKTGKNGLLSAEDMPAEIQSLVVQQPEEPVDNEKSAQELHECLEEIGLAWNDDTVSELNIDRTFKFKDANFNCLFTNLDAELIDILLINLKPDGAFSLDFEFSMHTTAVLPDNDPAMNFFNLKAYTWYPYEDTASSSCEVTIKCDTDTESGGSYVSFNAPDKPFTGSLRVVFDGSKFVSEWPVIYE